MEYSPADLQKKELTMEANRANILAFYFSIPILLILIVPFIMINADVFNVAQLKEEFRFWASPLGVIIVLVVMAAGIVVHELIHGITFSVFAKTGFKSVKFGIIRKSLTPYCHCNEPLQAWQYRISSIMPAITMGIIPSIIAIVNGSIALVLFGIFFTIAAAGDFLIIYMLRKEQAKTLVQDHPEKIGCYVFFS